MPLLYVKISKPRDIAELDEARLRIVDATRILLLGESLKIRIAILESISEPDPICFDEIKNLLVRYRIFATDDDELLLVFDQLRDVFPEQGKGWIRNNDICFLQKFDAFLATEVAIVFEWMYANPAGGGNSTTRGTFAFVNEIGTACTMMLAEMIGIAVLIAGGDEFLELEVVEFTREVMEKVADLGVIAVAQDSLALEVLLVVLKLLLNVRKLCVEFILLLRLGGVKTSVQRFLVRLLDHVFPVKYGRIPGQSVYCPVLFDHLSPPNTRSLSETAYTSLPQSAYATPPARILTGGVG